MSGARWLVALFVAVGATFSLAVNGLGAPTAKPLPPPPASPSPSPSGSPVAETRPPFALPSLAPTENYLTFMHGAEHEDGVIDFVRKDDQLYLDLRADNFGKPYIIMPSIASGVGGEAFAGRIYDPLVVIFKRVDKRVMWITPNTRYVADKGTAAAASLAVSVADSVIQSTPVIAEDNDKTHVVINPSIFLSDFEGIGADLGRGARTPTLPGLLLIIARPTFSVDATKSYYLSTKAFPLNDEIAVNLTFNGPPNALPTVPDGRGIPIVVHYSIVAPPVHDPTYVPRYADDRIGYFITMRKHFGNDMTSSPYERFIDRWNLQDGPIVFTLTNEIPLQYRATVRRGILAWNAAFAKIGYPNAIQVRDPPADPHFDPEDARYNSVRWITSDSPDFVGLSTHVSDPDTGQIIRAEVVLDGEAVRIVRDGYADLAQPMQRAHGDAFGLEAAAVPAAEERGSEAGEDWFTGANQAAIGTAAMLGNPWATTMDRERYAQAFLFSTVMHEVGHALGLRHNFEGSTAYTYAQLHDPAFTRAYGTTGSVMDYNGVNLAAPGERQADYFPNRPGPYDQWAIAYGYTNFHAQTAAAERPQLARIAARSTLPGLAYGTDEDADAPLAIDPLIQPFDLSSDPLRYVRSQFIIDDEVTRQLVQRYAGDRRTYQDLRKTFVTVLNNDVSLSEMAARYVGGITTSRAHRGQAGGTLPFRPVARSEQRAAFALIDRYVLSSAAFRYPPQLLAEVEPTRFSDWSSPLHRIDFPIREVVAELQDDALAAMFNPSTLARIADVSLRAPGTTMSLEDLFAWTNAAVFDDLGAKTIPPLQRDLQRRFADLELTIAFLSSSSMAQLGLPYDLQSLARYHLQQLSYQLVRAERAATDVGTRAHLDDLRSRVEAGLHPEATRPF